MEIVSGGSNITSHGVSRQPETPTSDESATPVISAEMIASDTTGSTDDPIHTPPVTAVLYGDADGDGNISSIDALYVLKKVVGKIDQFPLEQAA